MAKTICFTGRRPKFLCGYISHDAYKPFVAELREIIRGYYNKGYRRFITGGAQGFDQLAFWAVDQLKSELPDIENIVYIPYRNFGQYWAENGVFSRSEYRLMLSRATDVYYCIDRELTDSHEIIKALMERNHAMVNDSDFVIALHNSPNFYGEKGGTAECMKYAFFTKRLPLLHIKYAIKNNHMATDGMEEYDPSVLQGNPAN